MNDTRVTVEIDHLEFVHKSDWTLIKYDESPEFLDGINRIGQIEHENLGTKAVDVIGLNDRLYLIELKDYRGRQSKEEEMVGTKLALVVAFKVRDTLAGILGAFHQSPNQTQWQAVMDGLCNKEKPPMVVLVLDRNPRVFDPSLEPWRLKVLKQREKSAESTLRNQLKKKVAWFTTLVDVSSASDHPLPNLELHYKKSP